MAVGNNYYRLKQTDINGQFRYSRVLLLTNPLTTKAFAVINNPFSTYVDVELGNVPQGPVSIRLFDIAGRQLYQHSQPASGLSRIRVDLSQTSLSAGIYVLELGFGLESHVARIIKQ